jgi:DNA primase
MSDQEPGRVQSDGERKWLREANAEAANFYRQELLQTRAAWPATLLKEWGVEAVLDHDSVWQVGYAPDGGSRCIDHLQRIGFAPDTLMRAGLMSWTNDGRVVDRYRDQLVMVSRDQALDPVGFVGIDRHAEARLITPETPVHRPLEAVVGLLEQVAVLEAGATMVVVDHPFDAITIQQEVSHSGKENYVGVPLIGLSASQVQAQTLRQYSRINRIIVTASTELQPAERAIDSTYHLAHAFDNVRLLQRSLGQLELIADIHVVNEADNSIGDQYIGHGLEDPGPSL